MNFEADVEPDVLRPLVRLGDRLTLAENGGDQARRCAGQVEHRGIQARMDFRRLPVVGLEGGSAANAPIFIDGTGRRMPGLL